MLNRRQFISAMAAATAMTAVPSCFASSTRLSHKERVDRALRGEDVDRPPFSFWHHYKRPTAQLEAQDHLEFHRRYDTDFVKVMNDFDYPRSTTGKWYELEPLKTPYPEQLHTLELVRDGLQGDAYFIDTLYGPYMTAMLLLAAEPGFAGKKDSEDRSDVISSIHSFQKENTAGWEQAMEAITQSTINHIRRSQEIGCSGTLVSIFNATSKFGSVSDYERYSRPYDKRVLAALADTKLTLLHLHTLETPYLDQFEDSRPRSSTTRSRRAAFPSQRSARFTRRRSPVEWMKWTLIGSRRKKSVSSGRWRGSRREANTSLPQAARFPMRRPTPNSPVCRVRWASSPLGRKWRGVLPSLALLGVFVFFVPGHLNGLELGLI